MTCGGGEDVAKLDGVDVIADATTENPNGSCETVLRGGSAPGAGGRDCPTPGTGTESGESAAPQRGPRPPMGAPSEGS